MAIPDFQTVMLPVLRAAADGEVRISSTVERLADEFGLTEDECAELLPSGRQPVIYSRVQWAKTYLTRAGLLKTTRRGHFEITDRGKKALAEHPQKIDNNYLMQFEEFIALGKSGDGGVDGVIDQDSLGLDRVYIQAKRYAQDNPVGSPAIRDFSGSLDMRRATKGVFVTTSSFTKEALETASQLSRHVVLINGDRLAALMIRYDVGVRVDEALYLKKIDEDFFPG
jgi:restriction endonuclease Mrr